MLFYIVEAEGEHITADDFVDCLTKQRTDLFFTDQCDLAAAEMDNTGGKLAVFAAGRLS